MLGRPLSFDRDKTTANGRYVAQVGIGPVTPHQSGAHKSRPSFAVPAASRGWIGHITRNIAAAGWALATALERAGTSIAYAFYEGRETGLETLNGR